MKALFFVVPAICHVLRRHVLLRPANQKIFCMPCTWLYNEACIDRKFFLDRVVAWYSCARGLNASAKICLGGTVQRRERGKMQQGERACFCVLSVRLFGTSALFVCVVLVFVRVPSGRTELRCIAQRTRKRGRKRMMRVVAVGHG